MKIAIITGVAGGIGKASALALAKKGYTIVFKCDKCGQIRKNKMAEDDNFDLLMEIVRRNSF